MKPLKSASVVLMAVLFGCGDSATVPDLTAPVDLVGDAARGQVEFVQECASCHASRDGYDLAVFGFSKLDVFRRSLGHVDEQRSRDIAAYVETLQPDAILPRTPFQPEAGMARSDEQFWTEVFGTYGWPENLTPEDLRQIDVRSLRAPLAMPAWSLEDSDEDWMPDLPLPTQVLEHNNGMLQALLDAYYAHPTEANLLRAIEPFKPATEGVGLICWEDELRACFEARRWMASFTAQHYLRTGQTENIPLEVVETWWDVGTTVVSLKGKTDFELEYTGFDRVATTYIIGARWTYLAYSYYPEAFNDPSGYMGTFLASQNLPRTAVMVALKRMVGDGPAHEEHVDQFIQDGFLAIREADYALAPKVTEFVFNYWAEQLESRGTDGLILPETRGLVAWAYNNSLEIIPPYSPELPRLAELRERVMSLLQN